MPEWTIGALAKEVGVAASALRFYDREGLVRPTRRVGGQRRYGPEALGEVALIQLGKEAGFSLSEIKTLLVGVRRGDKTPRTARLLAAQKLPEVEATIARATLVRKLLLGMQECSCPTLQACVDAARRAGLFTSGAPARSRATRTSVRGLP